MGRGGSSYARQHREVTGGRGLRRGRSEKKPRWHWRGIGARTRARTPAPCSCSATPCDLQERPSFPPSLLSLSSRLTYSWRDAMHNKIPRVKIPSHIQSSWTWMRGVGGREGGGGARRGWAQENHHVDYILVPLPSSFPLFPPLLLG